MREENLWKYFNVLICGETLPANVHPTCYPSDGNVYQLGFRDPHRDAPLLIAPEKYEVFRLKEQSRPGWSGIVLERSEVLRAIDNFASPKNSAGGRACHVSLIGNTISYSCQPGYGIANLWDGIHAPSDRELLSPLVEKAELSGVKFSYK